MEILNFFVCNDIRKEIGGKNTIIGVYDYLNIPKEYLTQPMNFHLCFYCTILKKDEICNKFEFTATNEGKQIVNIKNDINITKNKRTINIALKINSVPIQQTGKIKFSLRFYYGNALIEELHPQDMHIYNVMYQSAPDT